MPTMTNFLNRISFNPANIFRAGPRNNAAANGNNGNAAQHAGVMRTPVPYGKLLRATVASGLSHITGGLLVPKPSMRSERIREVFSGLAQNRGDIGANAPNQEESIATYNALSILSDKILQLKKVDENIDAYSPRQQKALAQTLKREIAQSMLDFINIGDNNDGLRLLNLMIAEADNPGEVQRIFAERRGEENQPPGAFQTSATALELLGKLTKGFDPGHESVIKDIVKFVKEMPKFGYIVRILNSCNLNEQKALMNSGLNSYIRNSNGNVFWRGAADVISNRVLFSNVLSNIDRLKQSQSEATRQLTNHLIQASGQRGDEYSEINVLMSVDDETDQDGAVRQKMEDAVAFAGELTLTFHKNQDNAFK